MGGDLQEGERRKSPGLKPSCPLERGTQHLRLEACSAGLSLFAGTGWVTLVTWGIAATQ